MSERVQDYTVTFRCTRELDERLNLASEKLWISKSGLIKQVIIEKLEEMGM